MAETIHKGWLKTREDEKFAPKTFIDNVFDSTGKQYDAVIKDHINSVAQTIKIDGIDTSVEDTFYVCDNSGNVITRIDKDGVHSIDFTISNNSVKEALAGLTRSYELVSKDVEDIQESLQNLDTSDSNAFYICDGSGNVIFRVDAEGAFSTNFSTKSGDLNDVLSRLTILQERLSWMDETDDTVFMIVDNKGNKAFEISSATNGAMAYDFVLPEVVSIGNVEVNTLREAIAVLDNVEADLTVLEGTAAKDSDLQALEGRVDSLTQTITALDEALDWEDDSNFTIVDSNGNKIATFDTSGSTSINFVIGTTGWDKKYDNLVEVIDALISLENKYASTIGDPSNPVDGTVLYRLAQLDSWKSIASSQIAQLQEADIALSGRIDVLEDFKDNIDNTYATDEDVKVLAGRISDLEAADILINADIDALEVKDSGLQSQITTLSGEVDKIQEVIDVEEDTTVIITDASNNKIVEVNQSGITSIDFVVSQYYTNENGESVILNEKSPNSLIGVIDAINNLDSKYATDTQLSDAIATEKSRAMDAESSLRTDIGIIQGQIGDIPENSSSLISLINELREDVGTIEEGDDNLQAQIINIEENIIGEFAEEDKDKTLNGLIDEVQVAIANEKSRAEDAESSLSQTIGAITDTTNTTLWGAINAEIARATEAEKGLSDRIDVIINNPETAETIDSIVEFTKYIEEHGKIAQGFSDDISDLKSADTTINGRIDDIEKVIDVTVGDTALTVVDQNNFKIMEVDNTGVASVDFIVSPIYDASGAATERTPNSLVSTIDKLNSLDAEIGNKPSDSGITSNNIWAALVEEKNRAGGVESGLRQDVDSKVPETRTINGQELTNDITINKVAEAEKATKDGNGDIISATYLKVADAFTQATADGLYAPLSIKTTVDGHTQAIDALRVFKNIKVGDTTISADTGVEDTLTLVAGDGITLTPDAVNDSITINGTAEYTLPIATTSALGGIKTSAAEENISAASYVFLNTLVEEDSEQLFVALPKPQQEDNVVSLPGMDWEFTIPESGISNGFTTVSTLKKDTTTGEIEASIVATGEDGFKLKPGNNITLSANATDKTITINASSTIEGSAGSADKLTNEIAINLTGDVIGFASTDFSGDVTIDTTIVNHHQAKNIVGASSTATTNGIADNPNVYLNLVENDQVRSSHNIKGTGAITVASDINGHIIINSTDAHVTEVGNHYEPTANVLYEINADALSATEAAWGNTSLVTGVNIQRDAKGHVTDITLDAVKMPANPIADFDLDYVDTSDNTDGKVSADSAGSGDITWENGVGHVKDNSHAHTIANITGLSDKIDPISMDDTSTFKIVDNSGNILAEFNAAEGLVVPKIKVQNVAGNAEWVPAYLAADTSIELEII